MGSNARGFAALPDDIERGDAVSLGESWEIENVVDETLHLEPCKKRHLTYVDELRRTFAHDLDAE